VNERELEGEFPHITFGLIDNKTDIKPEIVLCIRHQYFASLKLDKKLPNFTPHGFHKAYNELP
jgi:hypothetical protein